MPMIPIDSFARCKRESSVQNNNPRTVSGSVTGFGTAKKWSGGSMFFENLVNIYRELYLGFIHICCALIDIPRTDPLCFEGVFNRFKTSLVLAVNVNLI